MLFNSFIFIFLFLPITLALFFIIGGRGHYKGAMVWLVSASWFFYSWWNPIYLGLLLSSSFFNYLIGRTFNYYSVNKLLRIILLTFGILANLALLGYFKYANFFVYNLNDLFSTHFHLSTIVLPLAISFFTFQQIAYLVDAYRGITYQYGFWHYCLFVAFFPQLIAGPIVHHHEIFPQFTKNSIYHFNLGHFAIGITVFFIGLFKKTVIADGMAQYANPIFDAALQNDTVITLFDSWIGALAYTFQIYFDFSGYSDMAIGLAYLFNIRLPLNFYSPYKANNIIDFWRFWHITLSRFLRDYLYIPLGGNRKGYIRRYLNLLITMLLGGLWHGAGWTFIIWGGLHGIYLIINHTWLAYQQAFNLKITSCWYYASVRILTFMSIVVAWVFFRAENINAALKILYSMSGGNGILLKSQLLAGISLLGPILTDWNIHISLEKEAIIWCLLLFVIIWFLPNVSQFMWHYQPALNTVYKGKITKAKLWRWKPNIIWGLLIGIIIFIALLQLFSLKPVEFLYFNF